MVKIAPSILSADFTRLGQQVQEAEAAGADWIHVDVMDGHFVPNITMGPPVVRAVRGATRLPLDVHLMVTNPDHFLAAFADAGADHLTVHVEACLHLHRTLARIRELGLRCGVTLNPATPIVTLAEAMHYVDLILVMTVEPGYSGQPFIPRSVARIRQLRQMLDDAGLAPDVVADGGIDSQTAPAVVAAGANVLVAGTAVYGHAAGIGAAIRQLRADGPQAPGAARPA